MTRSRFNDRCAAASPAYRRTQVVTIGPPAAVFYLKNRDQLFPAARLVIGGLDDRFVQKSALREGDIVVANHWDTKEPLENILRVLPDTQTVAVGSWSLDRGAVLAQRPPSRVRAIRE